MKKLAVYFPGIGYTVDKPLMHYSRKIAADKGFEIRLLPYSGFPNIAGDPEGVRKVCRIALSQTESLLSDIDLSAYDSILFVGKSIGTAVAAEFAEQSTVSDRIHLLLYTPLEETFRFPLRHAVAFTGSADQFVPEGRIPALCQEYGIPCLLIPAANHSLETGDVQMDLDNLKIIMEKTADFIGGL